MTDALTGDELERVRDNEQPRCSGCGVVPPARTRRRRALVPRGRLRSDAPHPRRDGAAGMTGAEGPKLLRTPQIMWPPRREKSVLRSDSEADRGVCTQVRMPAHVEGGRLGCDVLRAKFPARASNYAHVRWSCAEKIGVPPVMRRTAGRTPLPAAGATGASPGPGRNAAPGSRAAPGWWVPTYRLFEPEMKEASDG